MENESSDRVRSLKGKLDAAAAAAVHEICMISDILKVRAAPDENTAAAIAWLNCLCWAIEDCHEYKMIQLITNCDETVIVSIHNVLQHLRTLTIGASCMFERFTQHAAIPRPLVIVACEFGRSIKDMLNS